MLSQYTADMLIVEQRILSAPAMHPVHPGSGRPGGLRQHGHERRPQDTVRSWTTPTASSGIEFIAAAQGLDFREFTPGRRRREGPGSLRKHVTHLDVDRPLFTDHNTMKALVKSCEILEAVEAEVGGLG